MTQRQKHRCQLSQRHLHLEFNLDVFYLHPTQRRVDGPQKAPVDLLKTTLSTRCAAHDPEAVRSEQCGSSLLRTCATSLRSHTSLRCAGAFSSGEFFFFLFSLTLGFNRISVAPFRQKRIGSARMAAERHITASQSVSVYMRCTLGINFCLLVPYRFVTSSLWHFWKGKKKKEKKNTIMAQTEWGWGGICHCSHWGSKVECKCLSLSNPTHFIFVTEKSVQGPQHIFQLSGCRQ